MYLSYSKLSSFERCPYSYRKIYIEKVKLPPKKQFSFGHSLHRVLEKFYSGKFLYSLGIKKPAKEYLLKLLDRNWISEGYTGGENEMFFKEAAEILDRYYETFINGIFAPAWRVEAHFSFRVAGHVVSGYIDRIQRTEDGFEIIDYKTHKRVPSIPDLRSDMQLPIYSLAGSVFFRKKVSSVSNIFLRFTKKISFSSEEFNGEEIKDRISRLARRIKNEESFSPKKNRYCGLCDFRYECGMYS